MAKVSEEEKRRRANDKIVEGIERLRDGKKCPKWVAREILSLDAAPSVEQVWGAVHSTIHQAERKERLGDRNEMAVIAIRAGAIALS